MYIYKLFLLNNITTVLNNYYIIPITEDFSENEMGLILNQGLLVQQTENSFNMYSNKWGLLYLINSIHSLTKCSLYYCQLKSQNW